MSSSCGGGPCGANECAGGGEEGGGRERRNYKIIKRKLRNARIR